MRSPLFRESVSSKAEGSGLGLTFSAMVMELHHGSIVLEDSPPTSFLVSFLWEGEKN